MRGVVDQCEASSGGSWERSQLAQGGGELLPPRPGARQVQPGAPSRDRCAAGDVPQPVAQRLGLALANSSSSSACVQTISIMGERHELAV